MEARKKDLGELVPPEYDRTGLQRLQYLVRLESLINVGCHFGPDDLPPHVWDELIALNIERQYIDRVVDQVRDKTRAMESAQNQARAATGTPPPGGTIFKTSKPFR